jgi:hypothetical protein
VKNRPGRRDEWNDGVAVPILGACGALLQQLMRRRGMMKRMKNAKLITAGILFLIFGISTTGFAQSILDNGNFETGDYTGWTLVEGEGASPMNGTSGIASDGQTINLYDQVYDFFDRIPVTQSSFGLPRTHKASDGIFMAIQLQNGEQDHRMFQDVALPENAKTLSWDMFYQNMNSFFAPNQYLAVHVRDLNDNILETLFLSEDSSPLAIPVSHFAFDISRHAGSTVRIDVEMKVHLHFFDAGFDNFSIELGELDAPPSTLAPPGWSRDSGKKLGWSEYKKNKVPRGFDKGQKNGWKK